jgi:hypothetical protein
MDYKKFIKISLLFILLVILTSVFTFACSTSIDKITSLDYCLYEYEQEGCIYYCIKGWAQNSNDYSLCEYEVEDQNVTEVMKDRCYSNVAKENGNIDACDFVIDEGKKADCITSAAKTVLDPEMCEKQIDIDEFGMCLYYVAKESENIEICALIPEEAKYEYSFSKTAKEECQLKLIDEIGNYTCDQIWDEVERNKCYRERCENKECCDSSSSDVSKASCLVEVAEKTQDFDLCIEIQNLIRSNSATNENCIEGVIPLLENPTLSICEAYTEEILKAKCIGVIADEIGDSDVCKEMFIDEDLLVECLKGSESRDLDACLVMQDLEERDSCVRSYAIFTTENADYCNHISDSEKKRSCRSSMNILPLASLTIPTLIIEFVITLLGIIGLIFIIKRSKVLEKWQWTELPAKISLVYFTISRIYLLLVGIIMQIEIELLYPFVLLKPIRFLDLVLTFAKIRSFLAYNWQFFLLCDLLIIVAIFLIGYLSNKFNYNQRKMITYLIIALAILSLILGIFLFLAMAALSI